MSSLRYTEYDMENANKAVAGKNKLIGLPNKVGSALLGGRRKHHDEHHEHHEGAGVSLGGGKSKKIYKMKCGNEIIDVRIHGDTIYRVRPSHAPNKFAEYVKEHSKGKGKPNLKELAKQYKGGVSLGGEYHDDYLMHEGGKIYYEKKISRRNDNEHGYTKTIKDDVIEDPSAVPAGSGIGGGKRRSNWTDYVKANYHKVKHLPNLQRLKKLAEMYRS